MEDNNTKNEVNKPKIVPSYVKKNNIGDSGKNKKRLFKSRITKYIVIAIIILVLSGTLFFGYNIYLNNKYKGYTQYSEKMNIYGFGQLYDNESITEYQKVTKSEAIKLVVSATLNISNIDKIVYIDDKKFDNQEWVQYAVDNEMITEDEINESNYNKKATLMDCLNYLYMAKIKILNIPADVEAIPNFSDIDKYSNEEQLIIKDMVWNKILDNTSNNLNAYNNITKGELSKLIVLYCEKYNTITENDAKININPEKLPSNYTDFPYCLANVSKEIYETRYIYSDVSKFKKPSEIYSEYKENFYSMEVRVLQYMTTILNVDYNFINEEEFKNNLDDTLFNPPSDNTIKNYINYVKSNKIIIRGNCNIIYPVFYFDGVNYRLRCSISYNIESAEKKENLIFGDSTEFNVSYDYNDNKTQLLLDIPIKTFSNSKSLYINFESINKWNIES